MDTQTEIELSEVYIEETGETIPISKRNGRWEMDDAAHGIASRVDSETYGRFCLVLMRQINAGQTDGKVGRVDWNIC